MVLEARNPKSVCQQAHVPSESQGRILPCLPLASGGSHQPLGGFPGGSVVKNSPTSAGDKGLVPGLGRSPGERTATHSSILVWPSGLQSMGSQGVGLD